MTEPTERNITRNNNKQEHSTIESIRERFLTMSEEENYIIQIPFAGAEAEDDREK